MNMNSANGEKDIAFTEKGLLDARLHPKSIPTAAATELEVNAQTDRSKAVKMSRIQHFGFALALLAVLTITIVTASGNSAPPFPDTKKFQDLLASVEPAALHEVLHSHFKDKYQHGVYPEDKTAMEIVHKQNAEVAHSLVELAKRQNGGSNGTITTTTSTTVSTSETSTSETPSDTPTDSPTPTPTPTPTPPTTLSTTTQSSGSQTGSTSTTRSSTTPTETTSSASSTKSNGSSHSSPSVTQSVVFTTTLADGGVATVTSVTVVNADQAAGQGDGGSGSSTNTADVSLQTGSASLVSHQLQLSACVAILGMVVAWAL